MMHVIFGSAVFIGLGIRLCVASIVLKKELCLQCLPQAETYEQ